MTSNASQFYSLLFLLCLSFIFTVLIFLPFLSALALALIFAVVLKPIHKELHAQMPKWPDASALLTVCIGIVGILLPLIVLGVLLVNQAESLYLILTNGSIKTYLQVPLDNLGQSVNGAFPGSRFFDALSPDLDTYLKKGLEWIIQNAGFAFSTATSLLVSFFVFFFALYYLLRDGEELKSAILRLSPLGNSEDTIILNRLELAVNSVIKGNLSIALVQGVLTALGFTLFGVQNGIVWGTVAAFGSLIPNVGTALVFVPAVLFLFFTGNTFTAVGLLLWGVFIVGLVDNLLKPVLIGKKMHLHPLFILLAVLGGIAFFGPIGVFLGPLAISLFFTLLSIYSDMSKRV
jgi:predicted PurR-regulated permease PerM